MAGSGTGRRYTAEFMARQFERAKERGWSLFRLARESGISLPTLLRWQRRMNAAPARAGFVEVIPSSRAASGRSGTSIAIEVELASGDRVAVSGGIDGATIERVLALLARPC